MLVSMSETNQSIVRPVTVWPSLPKYTAREQAAAGAGTSQDVQTSEATATAMRVFIRTPWLTSAQCFAIGPAPEGARRTSAHQSGQPAQIS
jgi:hypothetical protein